MDRSPRVAELHRLLVEEQDERQRAEAHLELGRIALEQRRPDLAIRHFREALLLQPGLERARQALRTLGEYSRVRDASTAEEGRGRRAIRRLFGRLRKP
jgi:tetratricopeptide (TPR) repeat protein